PQHPQIYTLSLHDALPIYLQVEARALLDALGLKELARLLEVIDPPGELDLDRFDRAQGRRPRRHVVARRIDREARHALACMPGRSEEHTSELQSPCNLVCR